ncbi:AzlC family ABC transporter permease [Commensalibacter oyaizuii]|uniref:AzlC family ABC transporter permease n=1 Tax=Commensalibacter oyaizuii TaxID=3043873 RepID=A0ABT6Q358_9PROT|nr:AzlC family ABC transporter permease [Commensalibacter sp. TBRC 16381]MDI2091538.1 AzlC family ABC transporter permease [Commensalibacter sp. TBRC 16381]
MSVAQAHIQRYVYKECIRGFKAALPLMISFLPFGMLLGTQAKMHGMSLLEILLMCGINFAGGSEFVAVGLWQHAPPLLLIVSMTLLVNCRHVLMGVTMIPLCRKEPLSKILFSFFFLCDEAWALSLQDSYRRMKEGYRRAFSYPFYITVALCFYFIWLFSALLGVLVGPLLGDLTQYGFDMAFPAVFIVLLRGMWQGWRKGIPWAVSLIVACIVHLTVPGAWYVIAGAGAGLIIVLLLPENFFEGPYHA